MPEGALCHMQDLADSVYDMEKGNDWFLVAPDFADYLRAQVCHLWALPPASVMEGDGIGLSAKGKNHCLGLHAGCGLWLVPTVGILLATGIPGRD